MLPKAPPPLGGASCVEGPVWNAKNLPAPRAGRQAKKKGRVGRETMALGTSLCIIHSIGKGLAQRFAWIRVHHALSVWVLNIYIYTHIILYYIILYYLPYIYYIIYKYIATYHYTNIMLCNGDYLLSVYVCIYIYIYMGKKIAGPTPMQPIIWWLTKRSFTTPSKSGTEHACNININIYICVYIYKFRKYVHTFIFGCPMKSQIIISKLFTPTLTWTSHFHCAGGALKLWDQCWRGSFGIHGNMPSIAIMLFSSKIKNFKSLKLPTWKYRKLKTRWGSF